jgi:hypothetical protein
LLLMVDTSGNQQWMYQYGSTLLSESFSGVTNSIDGGIIVSGFKTDSTSAGNNFWLVKADAFGNLQWEKVFGDTESNEVSDAVIQLADGNIFLSGDKQVAPAKYNAWLVKADSVGNFIGDLVFHNQNNGGCKNLIHDGLGNLYVIGEAATDSSPQFDIQLCKADTALNLNWLKYIRASNESDAGFDLADAGNNNFMLTGYYYDTVTSQKRIQMMLIDSSGNELSRKIFGTSNINIGYRIVASVNGGFIIGGTDFIRSLGVLIYDNVQMQSVVSHAPLSLTIECFPNPVSKSSEIHFSYLFNEAEIKIYTAQNKEVSHFKIKNSNSVSLPQSLRSGIYFIRVFSDKGYFNSKLIIE